MEREALEKHKKAAQKLERIIEESCRIMIQKYNYSQI